MGRSGGDEAGMVTKGEESGKPEDVVGKLEKEERRAFYTKQLADNGVSSMSAWFAKYGGVEPGDYELTSDLDVYDLEDSNFKQGETIEEKIAELQQMIDACGDSDDIAPAPNTQPQTKADPASALRHKCEAMYDEVQTLAKAKRERERELLQNVRILQDRIKSQYDEKSSLTQRLLEATQKFGGKRREMLENEQELHALINAESEKKAQLQADIGGNLQSLKDVLENLNRQIREGWAEQAVLVEKLNEESANQSHYHSELKEEREKSWRQNRDFVSNMARQGKAANSLLNDADIKKSENGSDYQPSVKSAWPFGVLRGPGGLQQQKTHDTASLDEFNLQLKSQIESEKQSWEEDKKAIEEEKKSLCYQTWNQGTQIMECKRQLAMIQADQSTLSKRLAQEPQSPSRSVSRSPSLGNQDPRSMISNAPRPNTEIGMALKNAEDLREKIGQIEDKRIQLEDLEERYRDEHEEAVQEIEQCRASLTELQSQNAQLRAEKEVRLSEKNQAEQDEARLLGVVNQIQTETEQRRLIESLTREVKDQRRVWENLQDENDHLQAEVDAQQGCCFKSRPPPRPRPRMPPPGSSSSSYSEPAAQPPAPSMQREQSKFSGSGERKAQSQSSFTSSAPASSSTAPLPVPVDLESPEEPNPLLAASRMPPAPQVLSGSGAASSSTNPAQIGRPLPDRPSSMSTASNASAPAAMLGQRAREDLLSNPSAGARSAATIAVPGAGTGVGAAGDIDFTSGDLPIRGDLPMRSQASLASDKKKKSWSEKQCFRVCRVGEERWATVPPAPQLIVDAETNQPAGSVSEAVRFLKENPNYKRENDFYLLCEGQVWFCLYKNRKSRTDGTSAEDKARMAMSPYIQDVGPPGAGVGSSVKTINIAQDEYMSDML